MATVLVTARRLASHGIWKRSLPLSLSMTKETRLLDLIFIWRELRSHPELLRYASDAAVKRFIWPMEVFSLEEEISLPPLIRVFELRGCWLNRKAYWVNWMGH